MSNLEITAVVRAAIGFWILAFAAIYMYRKTQLDVFRSDVFAIRDEMFNYMWQHDRPFDVEHYTHMRDTLNGLIRFSHQFDLSSIVLAAIFTRDDRSPSLLSMIEAIPHAEERAYFQAVYHRVAHRAWRYVMFEGSQALIVLPVVAVYQIFRRFRNHGFHFELPSMAINKLMAIGRVDSDEARLIRGCLGV